jgi:hypothetical protein
MRNLTFEIQPTDCVGDSVGKHNYNILSIDTAICNLSSECFIGSNSILTWFNDLSSLFDTLNVMYSNFSNNAISGYQINHQIINTLSSYWDTPEFTVMYEYNNYTLDGYYNNTFPDNLTTYAPTSAFAINDFTSLSGNMKSYLSNNFPASTYNLNTRANVVIPIFTLSMNAFGNVLGSVYIPLSGADYVYPNGVVNNAQNQLQINSNAVYALASTGINGNISYNDDYQSHYVYSDTNPLGKIIPPNTSIENYNRTVKIKYNQNNIYTQNLYTVKFIAGYDPRVVGSAPNAWIPYQAIIK